MKELEQEPGHLTATTSTCLNGFVYVNEGDVLTMEAGTVIQAKAGQGRIGQLFDCCTRTRQIMADGTADCPIIFTYEGDPLNGSTPYNTRIVGWRQSSMATASSIPYRSVMTRRRHHGC